MISRRRNTKNLYKVALTNSIKYRSFSSHIQNKFYKCMLNDFIDEISLDFFSNQDLCNLDYLLSLYIQNKCIETKCNIITDIYNIIYTHYLSIH